VSGLDLQGHTDREFSAVPELEGEAIQLRLTGTADMHAIDPLSAILDKLHLEALRLATKQIVVDVRQLEFMNSSCLKAFVSWIAALQETTAPQQYRITFLSNPELRWQRRSLHALSCFASDLITVES